MDWNAIGQGVATGLGAAVPLGVGVAWVILKAFDLGKWKETLATKEEVAELKSTVAGLTSTVAGLASTVASLATTVEATRSDVGRIVEHLLSSKQE